MCGVSFSDPLLTACRHKRYQSYHLKLMLILSEGQARRQHFAAGGAKSHKGATFFNTISDVCTNRRAKHEMGGGHHWSSAGDGPAEGIVRTLQLHISFLERRCKTCTMKPTFVDYFIRRRFASKILSIFSTK